jgi:hypothetical protein
MHHCLDALIINKSANVINIMHTDTRVIWYSHSGDIKMLQ